MFETPLPFDASPASSAGIDGVRVAGGVGIRIVARHGRSVAADVSERDGYKVRFPRGTAHPEAVIINTGGGLAGGDKIRQRIDVEQGARATITTQASERVYRALGQSATSVDVSLSLGEDAVLNWLPQETILFDKSRLKRSIDVEIAPSARLLMIETLVFGRTAMGETVQTGTLSDCWRIRSGGRLIFAENLRLDGAVAETLSKTAVANGAHIVSTLIAIRPDAEDMLGAVRSALEDSECETGASAWGPRLILRAIGHSNEAVRRVAERVVPILSGEPLPRVWQT